MPPCTLPVHVTGALISALSGEPLQDAVNISSTVIVLGAAVMPFAAALITYVPGLGNLTFPAQLFGGVGTWPPVDESMRQSIVWPSRPVAATATPIDPPATIVVRLLEGLVKVNVGLGLTVIVLVAVMPFAAASSR